MNTNMNTKLRANSIEWRKTLVVGDFQRKFVCLSPVFLPIRICTSSALFFLSPFHLHPEYISIKILTCKYKRMKLKKKRILLSFTFFFLRRLEEGLVYFPKKKKKRAYFELNRLKNTYLKNFPKIYDIIFHRNSKILLKIKNLLAIRSKISWKLQGLFKK